MSCAPPLAGAASNESFAIVPYGESGASRSNFILELAPGQNITDRISVFNYTDQSMTFNLFGADAYNASGGGAFALRLPDPDTGVLPSAEDLGAWIDVPVSVLVVPPGTRTDVPFTVTVPLDAEPGDHAGGIVALDTQPRGGDGPAGGVATKQALGVRIYVRVDGPLRPQVTVADTALLTGGEPHRCRSPARRTPKLASLSSTPATSASHQPPRCGSPTLFGREVASASVPELPELLPGQSIEQGVPLGELSGFGPRYRLVVTADAQGTQSEGSATAWVVPWLLLALLVVLIVIFVVLRRRSAGGDDAGEATAPTAPAQRSDGRSVALMRPRS